MWPDGINYWPPWATPTARMESLQEAFAGMDFELCSEAETERGYLKVALYEMQGAAKHAAIQMPNGRWRSKLGRGPVIEHLSPDSLSGGPYGNPTVTMRRVKAANEDH